MSPFVMRQGKRIEVVPLDTGKPKSFSLDRFKSKRDTPTTAKTKRKQYKNFAIVPLDSDWGYRAMTIAGHGAAIVLYALYKQRAGASEVPITATVLKQCGISRKMRALTIKRLVESGFATARYRGNKFCGCPLLTLLLP
jgi:hypothetical protein